MDASQTNSGSNPLIVNTDRSKIFLGGQQTESDSYINNSTYAPITLLAGTVMGRISSTGILAPWRSTSTDGTQTVLGILMTDLVIDQGATVKAPVCVSGRVAAEKIIAIELDTQSIATTLEIQCGTAPNNRRLKDKIQGETVGVKLVYSTEMTYNDNQ